MANDIEVSVGYQDIQTLRRELVGIAKDAKTSATTFEREFNKVERTLKANAKASQTYYASVLKLDQASKSASASASVFVKALNEEAKAVKELAQVEKDLLASRAKLDAIAKQEANTLDQLKSKYQAGYGAMKTFKGEVEQLNLALKLGVVSQDEYKAKVEQLSVALAKGTGIFGAHANQARGYMNRLGVITQQAGYQVGDFFVQIQSGTNVFVALGQQATQLAGTFAMLATSTKMIGIFTGLGIAIPIVTSILAFMTRTTKETSNAVDVFKELTQATRQLYLERRKLEDPSFDENLQGTDEELKKLTASYNNAKAAVENYALAQSYVGTDITPTITDGRAAQDAAEAALREAEAKLKSYNIEKTLILIAKTKATLEEQSGKQRIAYQDAYFQKLREEAELRREISDKVGEAYLSAIGLNQQPMDVGINKAAAAAQVLAERLGISLSAARNIVNLEAGKGFQAKDYSGQSYGGARAEDRMTGSSTPPVIKAAIASGSSPRVAQIKETTLALEKETEANKALETSMNTVSSNITNAFMSMVDGSNTVVGAFRNMMFNILKSVYEQSVAQPIANTLSSALFAGFSGSGPQTGSMGLPNFKFADGGVVGSPTTFQMSGGKTGLMGEAGPEAIMPLKRGSNGQLGVQVNGGSGGMTVNNNITVTGSDAAAVRMEVAKMIPQITNATKAAIIDAKKRGGQMGAAFA